MVTSVLDPVLGARAGRLTVAPEPHRLTLRSLIAIPDRDKIRVDIYYVAVCCYVARGCVAQEACRRVTSRDVRSSIGSYRFCVQVQLYARRAKHLSRLDDGPEHWLCDCPLRYDEPASPQTRGAAPTKPRYAACKDRAARIDGGKTQLEPLLERLERLERQASRSATARTTSPRTPTARWRPSWASTETAASSARRPKPRSALPRRRPVP